jgi:hypothetical protein
MCERVTTAVKVIRTGRPDVNGSLFRGDSLGWIWAPANDG